MFGVYLFSFLGVYMGFTWDPLSLFGVYWGSIGGMFGVYLWSWYLFGELSWVLQHITTVDCATGALMNPPTGIL